MRRAGVIAVCALVVCTGCTLLVSIEGLTGAPVAAEDAGAPPRDASRESTSLPPPPQDATADAVASSRYRDAVLADEPALYLRFGEAQLAVQNEVGALSAAYPDGTTRGVPGALAGDPDTAVTFAGGILELPAGLDLAGDTDSTIELWLRVSASPDGFNWVLDHQLWDGSRRGWDLLVQNGFITYERWDGTTGSSSVGSQVQIPIGEWHHVVAQRDSAGQRLFYDGELKENRSTSNVIPTTGPWTVGGITCTVCGDRFAFQGSIDELAIYTHRLTPARIGAHLAAAR